MYWVKKIKDLFQTILCKAQFLELPNMGKKLLYIIYISNIACKVIFTYDV